jgi:hypothetical protein
MIRQSKVLWAFSQLTMAVPELKMAKYFPDEWKKEFA